MTLSAQSGLLVGGAVDTSGAAGAAGRPGGGGGTMLLSAAHGPLTLGGRLRSEGGAGGAGGAQGALGGNAGAIEIVVSSIASSTGVLSGGGNGGNSGVQGGPRGRGGDGGRVRVWSQLPSLILLQLVDSTGGTGDPNGTDGPQQEESAPTALSIVTKTRTLSFTPHSPEAEGYRVFASLAGAPAKAIMTTKTERRRAAEGPGLRQGGLRALGLPQRRRLAERSDRSRQPAAAAVCRPGLHGRAAADAPGAEAEEEAEPAAQEEVARPDALPGRRHGHGARRALAREEAARSGRQAARRGAPQRERSAHDPQGPAQSGQIPRDRER